MMPCALAIALLAAQDKKDDPFKDMQYGFRVEIILKTGFGVLGQLLAEKDLKDPKGERDIELPKATTILLDMSLEYPDLGGRKAVEDPTKFLPNIVGFERNQVKSVRRLKDLSPAEVAAREKAREEAYSRILVEEANRRKMEAEIEAERRKELEERLKKKRMEEAKTAEGQLKQAGEKLQKAREIYEKYGESLPEKLKELEQKNIRKQPLTEEDKQMLADFADWAWYKANVIDKPKEEPKKEGEGEKKEGEKKEEKQPN